MNTSEHPALLEHVAVPKSQLLLNASRLSLGAMVVLGLSFFLAQQLTINFPLLPLLACIGVYVLSVLVVGWLRGKGAVEWAARLYFGVTALALLVLAYFLGGPTGPLYMLFLPLLILTGLLLGRSIAALAALGLFSLTLVWVILDSMGLFSHYPLALPVARLLTLLILGFSFPIALGMLSILLRSWAAAAAASQQRDAELSAALARAESAIRAEGAAREQTALLIEQLQEGVQAYLAFLQQIAEGDFAARLDLETLARQVENPTLLALGAALNRTVETLVTALTELRVAQQRYLQEAWSLFLEAEQRRRGFRARDATVEVTPPAWRATMATATAAQRSVVQGEELAVPIAVRGEVVGAVGARRTDGQPWTAEELALIEAVIDQLGQTLETLRLLEETQRQAQREQVLSDLSVRFSRSFDVDMLLQQAVVDLGRLLNLDEVAVYVEPAPVETTSTAETHAAAEAPQQG